MCIHPNVLTDIDVESISHFQIFNKNYKAIISADLLVHKI